MMYHPRHSVVCALILLCGHQLYAMHAARHVAALRNRTMASGMSQHIQQRQASTLKFFHVVSERESLIIERFGKFNRVQSSGLQFKWPLIESARDVNWTGQEVDPNGNTCHMHYSAYRIDERERVYDLPRQSVITKDNVAMGINALVYYEIQDPKKAVYGIDDLPLGIEKLAQTTLRNIIGSMHLDETLTSRDEINAKLCTTLDGATDKWGVAVTRVELQEVSPPKGIEHAMEQQMTAERTKRAEITDAEGKKMSSILRAEGRKESRILDAEGERQEQILHAQGEAESIQAVAAARRKALDELRLALDDQDPSTYALSTEYIKAFGRLIENNNSKTVVVPTELSGLAGLATSVLSGLKDKKQK